MFTGIVEEIGKVIATQGNELIIAASHVLKGMAAGNSIAVNGVCLTVTNFSNKSFNVELMPETLRQTNLRFVSGGSKVNMERPLTVGSGLGGHLVQGHVDGMGIVRSITIDREALIIEIKAPSEVIRYVVKKGFIAANGVSLTILNNDKESFIVSIVNFTRKNTILGGTRIGEWINLEVDIIAKYVEQFNQPCNNNITQEFLFEHGFIQA